MRVWLLPALVPRTSDQTRLGGVWPLSRLGSVWAPGRPVDPCWPAQWPASSRMIRAGQPDGRPALGGSGPARWPACPGGASGTLLWSGWPARCKEVARRTCRVWSLSAPFGVWRHWRPLCGRGNAGAPAHAGQPDGRPDEAFCVAPPRGGLLCPSPHSQWGEGHFLRGPHPADVGTGGPRFASA